jgi:hypothetical protein
MGSLSPLAATGTEVLGDEGAGAVVVATEPAADEDEADGTRSTRFSGRLVVETPVIDDGDG